MTAISTTTPSQPAVNTAAFAQIAPTLFAMDTMFTRWTDQLKMPRPDAYPYPAVKAACRTIGSRLQDRGSNQIASSAGKLNRAVETIPIFAAGPARHEPIEQLDLHRAARNSTFRRIAYQSKVCQVRVRKVIGKSVTSFQSIDPTSGRAVSLDGLMHR